MQLMAHGSIDLFLTLLLIQQNRKFRKLERPSKVWSAGLNYA